MTTDSMTDYERQAKDFLDKTGAELRVQYSATGKYFDGDEYPRDIYTITLKSGKGSFRFKFGQSIDRTDGGNTPPTAYDVLACMTKYDPGDFEDFCSEFGYETDSRSAKKTYHAVKKEYANLCRLFTDAELEAMQEIQ